MIGHDDDREGWMSYSQDFSPAEAVFTPASDGLMLDVPPLVLIIGLLLLLLAGYAGWMLARRRQPTSDSAAASIWKAIDDAIRAAMTAHSDSLRDKARSLTHVIDDRLGKTLALTGGLRALKSLATALDEAPHDDGHAGGHDEDHGPPRPGSHGDDHDPHDVNVAGSTVVIERARDIVIHAPAQPAMTGPHEPARPAPTEAERRHKIRQAVSDLNDHWRLKDARIAEIAAAHRELSAPRR